MRGVVAVLLMAGAAGTGAQVRPELRFEGVQSGARQRVEAGLGLGAPLGAYLRSGLSVSYDLWHDAGSTPRARVEGQIRFLLDPLADHRWGLSFAGGLGFRERAYLLLAAELEGPRWGGIRPAIRVGVGAGSRLGLVIRQARVGRR